MAHELSSSNPASSNQPLSIQSPNTQPCNTHFYAVHGTTASKAHGRRFLSSALLGCSLLLASTSSMANTETVKQDTATGVGVGAVVGTLAAGPFGFIAGSVIGGYIGEGQGYKSSANNGQVKDRVIADQETQIAQLEKQLATTQETLAKSEQQSAISRVEQVTQVEQVKPVYTQQQVTNSDLSLSVMLQFRFGQSGVEPMYHAQLMQIARFLLQNSHLVATITGFTDEVGAQQANLQLSQQRAEKVQEFLRQQGVSAQQLQIVGKGETAPLYDENSPQNRFFERRVLIELVSTNV